MENQLAQMDIHGGPKIVEVGDRQGALSFDHLYHLNTIKLRRVLGGRSRGRGIFVASGDFLFYFPFFFVSVSFSRASIMPQRPAAR